MERNPDQTIVGRFSLWVSDIDPSKSYWLLVLTDYGIYDPENPKITELINKYTSNSALEGITRMMETKSRLEVTLEFFLWVYSEDKELCFEIMKHIYEDFKDEDETPEPYEYVEKLEEFEKGEDYPDLDLDNMVHATPQVVGNDEEFEFYQRLHPHFESATERVFIVDSYVDEEVFELYLSKTSPDVEKRILTQATQGEFEAVAEKFAKRSDHSVEVRIHPQCHDRLLFVDDRCFAVGTSIKDAGWKPTYIVEFEAVDYFREPWNDLWNEAEQHEVYE